MLFGRAWTWKFLFLKFRRWNFSAKILWISPLQFSDFSNYYLQLHVIPKFGLRFFFIIITLFKQNLTIKTSSNFTNQVHLNVNHYFSSQIIISWFCYKELKEIQHWFNDIEFWGWGKVKLNPYQFQNYPLH